MPSILTIETPSLGDRSYLIHDGTTGLVIDPQRDIDRVLNLAASEGVTIKHVFETHIHNDYVTGGLALAEATGANYHVNAEDEVAFHRHPIRDGETIKVSDSLTVQAIATPGHTFTHLSYALLEHGQVVGVFTGGSLLFGATGRPDLLGPEHTDALVRHQYASAHRLAEQLPDTTRVLPTHGFGSFCSAGSTSGSNASTIGQERQVNDALCDDEETWVARVLQGLDTYPAYYVHMAPANAEGPVAPDLAHPTPVDRDTIAHSLAAGEWVVDLRTRTAYSRAHVHGSFNIGLDGQFSTYLGWLIPWGTPLTLLGESAAQVAEAQRELARIGIDQLKGAATGDPTQWTPDALHHYERATFADLAQVRHHRTVTVLDVRRAAEHDINHIAGAVNVPIHEILTRIDEIPHSELWIHCASGYRASIAASVLAAQSRQVVLLDDDFDPNAVASGLPLSSVDDGSSPDDV